jgi:hypothetical protein
MAEYWAVLSGLPDRKTHSLMVYRTPDEARNVAQMLVRKYNEPYYVAKVVTTEYHKPLSGG